MTNYNVHHDYISSVCVGILHVQVKDGRLNNEYVKWRDETSEVRPF